MPGHIVGSFADVFEIVLERGLKYRELANGYALGSGNSIPDFRAG